MLAVGNGLTVTFIIFDSFSQPKMLVILTFYEPADHTIKLLENAFGIATLFKYH
jgi:hypothetical protein